MKITRKQLRRLIEGSIRKRGDYVIPVEDPIEDPIAGLDYSDEQKPKIKTMAMSDDEQNQEHANFIADIGGHEDKDTNRFGAETFSKKVQAHELDVNLLDSDLDIDSAMTLACRFWIYERKDDLSFFDHIDQDNSRKYAGYMIEMFGGDQAVANEIKVHTTAVLEERIKKLIKTSNSTAPVPSVDEEVAKYENAKKLFSTDHNNPIVEEYVLFKLYSVLYPFYFDWKSYYEKESGYDMDNPESAEHYKDVISTFKEGKVRLTRRKLRKLIAESIINEMPMIKPGGDINPEHYEHITDMIDSDEEENIVHADFLASQVGHDSEHLSQDLKKYDRLSIMGAVGEFSPYLTDEDMQMLMNIAGEDLTYGLYGWSGAGFGNVVEGGPGITSDDMYEMSIKIASQKQNPDESDHYQHEGMDSSVNASHSLARAIIKLSNKTIVDSYSIEDLGIGEEVGRRTGHYKFWNPEYKKLWQNKKLIIRGYVEPSTLDLD